MKLEAPLPFGSTIGILGGGQLGRMMALAAARLGLRTHIFCPDPQSPAFEVAQAHTIADYGDLGALGTFARQVDVVTYEFENVPSASAQFLEERLALSPNAKALETSQDRLKEKAFLSDCNIPIAPYAAIDSRLSLDRALNEVGLPAVLKTTRFGYDGKGQRMLKHARDAGEAYSDFAGQPTVLEGFVPFVREISVIVARGTEGQIAAYDPAENVHRNHILYTSTVPATLDEATREQALRIARLIVRELNYVGVMGIEFFVAGDGTLLVNEIAPRVHNSGHWTEAVCTTDQFEQHIRAVSGWPLGDPARMADVVMQNLIGDEIDNIPDTLGEHDQPHNYGKAEARPGRKMGHINHVRPWRNI